MHGDSLVMTFELETYHIEITAQGVIHNQHLANAEQQETKTTDVVCYVQFEGTGGGCCILIFDLSVEDFETGNQINIFLEKTN